MDVVPYTHKCSGIELFSPMYTELVFSGKCPVTASLTPGTKKGFRTLKGVRKHNLK
jgi:hypothetical protein